MSKEITEAKKAEQDKNNNTTISTPPNRPLPKPKVPKIQGLYHTLQPQSTDSKSPKKDDANETRVTLSVKDMAKNYEDKITTQSQSKINNNQEEKEDQEEKKDSENLSVQSESTSPRKYTKRSKTYSGESPGRDMQGSPKKSPNAENIAMTLQQQSPVKPISSKAMLDDFLKNMPDKPLTWKSMKNTPILEKDPIIQTPEKANSVQFVEKVANEKTEGIEVPSDNPVSNNKAEEEKPQSEPEKEVRIERHSRRHQKKDNVKNKKEGDNSFSPSKPKKPKKDKDHNKEADKKPENKESNNDEKGAVNTHVSRRSGHRSRYKVKQSDEQANSALPTEQGKTEGNSKHADKLSNKQSIRETVKKIRAAKENGMLEKKSHTTTRTNINGIIDNGPKKTYTPGDVNTSKITSKHRGSTVGDIPTEFTFLVRENKEPHQKPGNVVPNLS